MIWRIEIRQKEGLFDSLGESIAKSIYDLGFSNVQNVRAEYIYNIAGHLTKDQAQRMASELLADPVTQDYYCVLESEYKPKSQTGVYTVEVAYNIGVMDPVEESTLKGIKDLGIDSVTGVRTARKYCLSGTLSEGDVDVIVSKVLANKLIQHVVQHPVKEQVLPQKNTKDVQVYQVDLLSAGERKLKSISQEGQLFLNLNEMKEIQKYYKKLGRNPTDCELETIAQTWSEHCYHKTFRGNIRYEVKENGKTKTRTIKNLLKSTIVKATNEINKSWCVSVFHDNAGVIKFDQDDHVCFKVETHNHPSALEPFGGANTGIGGVIRDILGTGLGAKPVCSTDVFCFAPPDMAFEEMPPGTLHPKRVMKGVVSGVRDYGNKMGIPTVNGAVLFDRRFVGNPLVYCGNVGIMPKDKVRKKVGKGDYVVAVGGKTGRDGIHGATFSSGELTTESEVVSSGAVQIGDPIQEKKVLDALLIARDEGLYTAITDCGAGGFSSAVGEMGQELGARVDLDKAPLKYQGLNYTEIWISESQERMVMSVPQKHIDRFLEVFAGENVEATVIGQFTGHKKLELFYNNVQVCDLDMEFLHEGTPRITKEAKWVEKKKKNPKILCPNDLTEKLFECLSHYNVCSKEWIIRQYDHEVQGGSIIKPLVGVANDGPSDASVVAPKLGSTKGIAISNGINFRYGMIDPFWMAASCIDEAVRQVVSVGGDVDKIAILDNFCWGNPDKADRLGGLVRCAEGCYKAAVGYQVPFISGKDSLYNEYAEGNKSIAIPGTILISAIGIIEDVTKTITMDLKQKDSFLYCIGETFDEMGGSIYLDTFDLIGSSVPKVNFKKGMVLFKALQKAIKKGLVLAAHDCSEGGLAVAAAEMAFSGGYGVDINLKKVIYKDKIVRNDKILFSESNTRFIVEVDPKNQKRFENALKDVPYAMIGRTTEDPKMIVHGLSEEICIQTYIRDLKEAWQKPLRF
ncbi:MAG: phosphoribosylformylglycinamidine synthase subunit PurL [Candidatus Omnitrophica bacterium]|nr:phosphoribosylformylglycinamidine synthase subunit PurL [Candidatus Omnitrophota bacterium]